MPKREEVLKQLEKILFGSPTPAIPDFMQQGILIEVGPSRQALGHRVGDSFYPSLDKK